MEPPLAVQVAHLQLEVRSLRAAMDAAEAERPRGAARVLLASISAATSALLTALVVMAVVPGASCVVSILLRGVGSGCGSASRSRPAHFS